MATYRLRLVQKAQMTVPVAMRDELSMKQGDELEVVVESGRIARAQVLRPVPTELFTPELIKELDNRAKKFESGGNDNQSTVQDLRARVAQRMKREANARETHSPV